MPEAALWDSVKVVLSQALKSDFDATLVEMQDARLVCGNRDEVIEQTTWTLTDRGEHKAKQIG